MRLPRHQQEFQRFIASLPIGSRVELLLTVFCLFASFGFVGDVASVGRHSAVRIALDVGLSGVMAILYSFIGTRSGRALAVIAVGQVIVTVLIARWSPPILVDRPELASAALPLRLNLDALGITVAVIVGYSALTRLLTREGSRYLRMRTEMLLAQDIHRGLVPALTGRHGGIDFVGASFPSGEVGGDLVDVVTGQNGRWVGYVADVSGHGVRAGVVMAMVKSALRMALARGSSLENVLADANDVVLPLISRNMFVTAAFVEINASSIQIALAGHLPILHFKRATRSVEEASVLNFALGFFTGHPYVTAGIIGSPGDILLVITDGFVDVFDKEDHEFGLSRVKEVLARHGDEPLDRILASLVAAARDHGPQQDDQTALLVRFTTWPGPADSID